MGPIGCRESLRRWGIRGQLKCDGTRAETRFLLSAKRTSPIKWAGASVQSTAGSRGVRISGSNAGYTMFRGSVKSAGYPLHSPVSPSPPLPYVTVCHHISNGLYHCTLRKSPEDRSPQQDSHCTYNVTLRRFRASIVAVEKQWVLYTAWVCVCSLRYPACNAHAPYCHLWPAPLYNIFPHYLINGTIFEKKKCTEQKKCFDFLYKFCLKHFSF